MFSEIEMVCIMSPSKPKKKASREAKEDDTIEINDESSEENTDPDDMKIETLFGGSISNSKPLFSPKGE